MDADFNDIEFLLDSVMAQRAQHAKLLLESVGLPRSGTKEQLRERLTGALADRKIKPDQLASLLDTVDAWGRQHVILYSAPDKIPHHFKSAAALQAFLDKNKINVKVNEPVNHVRPEGKTIRLISLTKHKLRVEWVETRHWTERLPSLDHRENIDGAEVVYHANKRRYQRAISAFEWNFAAQTAELFIHRLPSGNRYDAEEEAFKALLRPLVELDNFGKIRMRKALSVLKDSPGVRERKTNYVGASGAKLSMQSSGRSTTISAVPELKEHRDLLKRNKALGAAFLNCFWEQDDELPQEVHTHIDGFESRVGFLAQYSEASVRNVISRIRKAAS